MQTAEKLIPILYWAFTYVGNIPFVSARDNIARSFTAEQSSTLRYGVPKQFDWNASLAIDGYKFGRDYVNSEPRCSGTAKQNNPWWQVDLHTDHEIGKINIYGRLDKTDNLRGFDLFITSSKSITIPEEDHVYKDRIATAQYYSRNATYNIVTSRMGRYVFITLARNNSHLVLCEVEVYEVCPDFTHGDGEMCSNCGNCKNNEACQRIDGICPNGCVPGYQPNMCTSECPDRTYGPNCVHRCGHCWKNNPCDKVNGSCIRCAPGYKGQLCGEECDDFSYGDGCQSKCGNCKDDIPCNHISGACSSCKAGFYPQLCKTECQDGQYGEDCKFKCGHCKDSEVCDKKYGRCSACEDGYAGEQCTNACPDNTYGENCQRTCGHCRYGYTCHHVTGLCNSCAKGYKNSDKFCKTECPDYTFGYQCSHKCGHCKNSIPCIKINGTCNLGCSSGFEGDRCKSECSGKRFGEDCSKSCHCKDDARCNTLTGNCPNGLCGEGWGGSDCNTGTLSFSDLLNELIY